MYFLIPIIPNAGTPRYIPKFRAITDNPSPRTSDSEFALIDVDLRDRKSSNEASYELVASKVISEPSALEILSRLHVDKSLSEVDGSSLVLFTESELTIIRLIQSSNFKRKYQINGISPSSMSKELEEKLRLMFKEIQAPFLEVCPKSRKNFQ